MSAAPDDRPATLQALLDRLAAKNPELYASATQFLERLREVPTSPPVELSAQASRSPPELPVSEAAIQAALAHTFTLATKTPSVPHNPPVLEWRELIPQSEDERAAILAHATPIVIGGQRRLQLNDAVRGAFLDRVMREPLYLRLRDEASDVDTDEESFEAIGADEIALPGAWLRSYLTGSVGDVFDAPPKEVRAAADALTRLRHAGPGVVHSPYSLADVRRALGLSELLEPLRILVGARGGWNGDPPVNRFVGREEELTRLRSFVDELGSESVLESITRGFRRAVSSTRALFQLGEESVFFLVARGGIGKTSLIAQFVLTHALSQDPARRFPFAYLDFDRATLSTRDPRHLLLETARQVALQFPELEGEINAVVEAVRTEIADGQSPSPHGFQMLREAVQRATRGERAFLIVLDTMEMVQYDPRALEAVVHFVSSLNFTGSGDQQRFVELKIVASGRADVPELRTEASERSKRHRLLLEPLSVADAARMADGVGRDLLGEGWNPRWAPMVAGRPSDPSERREPLVIRVAVELIRAALPEEREALVASIEEDGENAKSEFVAKLYERRILDHVRDPDVRRLAWPGLVARRVSRDLVATILAPLCGIEPARVDTTFAALENEVWMVRREGDVLVHQPELRARTLPLMRRHNPEKFAEVSRALCDFFGARAELGSAQRAEWLYYRLLNGEAPEDVDIDWTDELAVHLAGAADDFPPDSEALGYLKGRAALRLLPPTTIARMPTRLALDHIAKCGAQLGAFDDSRIEPVVTEMALRIRQTDAHPTQSHPVKMVLLIKTGQWEQPSRLVAATGMWREHADFAFRFKCARTMNAGEDGGLPYPEGASSKLSIRALVQELVCARIRGMGSNSGSNAEALDDALAEIIELRLDKRSAALGALGAADRVALRTAVVFGWRATVPAAKLWLATGGIEDVVSGAELAEIFLAPAAKYAMREARARVSSIDDASWHQLHSAADARVPTRFGAAAFGTATHEALNQLLDHKESLNIVRRFFAARDQDWVVPLGYAANICFPPSQFAALHRTMAKSVRDLFPQVGGKPVDDMLKLVRWIDEAAAVDSLVKIILSRGGDLRVFTDYQRWRRIIGRILD